MGFGTVMNFIIPGEISGEIFKGLTGNIFDFWGMGLLIGY